MNAIDTIKPAGHPQDVDAKLLDLFADLKAAVADARAIRPFGHEDTAAAWRRRDELQEAILATPAFGPAGLAVKLALMSRHGLERIDRLDPASRFENERTEPLRSAFEDALRLAGLDRATLFALPVKSSRRGRKRAAA